MKNTFLRYWLPMMIHMFVMWVIINLSHLLRLYNSVNQHSNFLLAKDNFLNHNFDFPNYYYIINCVFILVPLVEGIYWLLISRSNILKTVMLTIAVFIVYEVLISIPFKFNELRIRFITDVLQLSLYALAYGYIRKAILRYLKNKTEVIERFGHEIQTLRAQWNPHFFFNSLNYLYGTALEENAPRTSEAIDILSKMMRYSVSSASQPSVPLRQELDFISQYLSIQKLRMPGHPNIHISQSFNTDSDDYKMPPMLILPFIENAFKYGISFKHPSFVKISLNVKKGKLVLEVINTVFESYSFKGNETGLVNTTKLLSLIYGNKHTFISEKSGNNFRVMLDIPLIPLFEKLTSKETTSC